MIIADYSRIKIDRILWWTLWGSGLAAAAFFLALLAVFCFYPWQTQEEMVACPQSLLDNGTELRSPLVAMSRGALALRRSFSCPFAYQLREELLVVGQNSRPDYLKNATEILVQLKTAQEKKIISVGNPIYLKKEGEQLFFSSEPTDLSVMPQLSAEGELILKAEKGQWTARASEELGFRLGDRFRETPTYARSFKEAKCWGLDPLFQHYAGPEHRGLREKHKIQFPEGFLFVAQGDYLSWQEGRWSAVSLDKAKGEPLARVKALGPKGVELEVWDESGFQKTLIKIDQAYLPKAIPHADQLPTGIRLRTSTQVACTLGKRRLILKEGDWLLRSSVGWRKLKTAQEIEDCLHHKIRGELFIFDELEKQQGKILLKGHLFDEMRTQMQFVQIPLMADKKKTTKHKK